jgi:hypothetical protein
VIANGLAAILFMIGYVLLGIAMMRTVHCLAGTGCWLQWVSRPA